MKMGFYEFINACCVLRRSANDTTLSFYLAVVTAISSALSLQQLPLGRHASRCYRELVFFERLILEEKFIVLSCYRKVAVVQR